MFGGGKPLGLILTLEGIAALFVIRAANNAGVRVEFRRAASR